MKESIQNVMDRVLQGEILNVRDAAWCSDGVSMGDFVDVGWTRKIVTACRGYSLVKWQWNGPSPIQVDDQLIQPGEFTPETEVDYS